MLLPGNSSNYAAALNFLWGRTNYERASAAHFDLDVAKLDRMRELARRLGDPHDRLRVVHVAGTKGKGSTAAMVACALTAAGYRTALYTSPHVHRIEERLCIDGTPCTAEEFAALADEVRPVVEAMDLAARAAGQGAIGPTYFEITTAMALLHFARAQVDAAVLEVGMGGRLDSTNICRPDVCAITSISLDHTRQLGDTLAAIAGEKAGIIKPGTPAISGVVHAEPREVIRRIAAERGSPLRERGVDFGVGTVSINRDGAIEQPLAFDYWRRGAAGEAHLPALTLGMCGNHQAANGAVAVRVLEELAQQGWRIPESAIRAGLSGARCPARVEIVSRRPTIIIDAAHNVASVEALLQTIGAHFRPRRKRLIFAVGQDKDAAGMLRVLLPAFDEVYLTQFRGNPRFVPAEQLALLACSLQPSAMLHSSAIAGEAWRLARAQLGPDDLLCVTGSFFLAGELRTIALNPDHS